MAAKMAPENVIQHLETLYKKLMTKDLTPDEEAQAKVELLEALSSIKAHAEIQQGSQAEVVLAQTNSLKDLLLNWDPYGSAWFKEEKTLINSVYNLLAAVKTMLMQKSVAAESTLFTNLKQQVDSVVSSLKTQMVNLQNEVGNIKKSVIALANAVKKHFTEEYASQQTIEHVKPDSRQKPVPLIPPPIQIGARPPPKPVPIPAEEIKNVPSKPLSIPKPVPILIDSKNPEQAPKPFQSDSPKPIPIPKPEPIQEPSSGPQLIPLDEHPGPSPIPILGPDLEEPISLDDSPSEIKSESQLFGALSASKEEKKKPSKEELFSLFSSDAAGTVKGEELDFELELSGSEDQPALIFPQETQGGPASSADAETFYQELISLEGKRYSIERSIRDLKTDRENGILSDQEYKEKLSQLVNKLQTISKRIEVIREKLD